jgi:predicted glycosyltransferase
MNPGKVFYAVLDMGLGHATRSLPIIKEFVHRKWEIWIGSTGRSLAFLKEELPGVSLVEIPGYGISYSHGQFLLPKLISQIPKLLYRIRKERKLCSQIVEKFWPDLIISDHCYGMYDSRIPSYFLSHQVYFALPRNLQMLSRLVSRFNFGYHGHYQQVLVPDVPGDGGGLLSGQLSLLPDPDPKYQFIGILSSIKRQEVREEFDLLVSVSGPEPQRSIFEKIVMEQIRKVPGKKIVVLGRSEENKMLVDQEDLKVYTHLPRGEMEPYFNKAALIITRPGYSTLMELAELGKKALLVPTPGQTEQQYLAEHLMEKKWFYSVNQNRISLSKDIEIAKTFGGLSIPGSTQQTVAHLFNDMLKLDSNKIEVIK